MAAAVGRNATGLDAVSADAAITAGVAPLLFVQVLYPRHFYTANLLLSWRWMVLVPALIAAFYLLYLLKSERFAMWPRGRRRLVALATAACLVFAAFCWMANHLLSIDGDRWADVYLEESVADLLPALWPRLCAAVAGSFSTMCIVAGWQMWRLRTATAADGGAFVRETRRMAVMATGGIAVALAAAYEHLQQLPDRTSEVVFSSFGWPLVALFGAGAAIQAIGWVFQMRRGELSGRLLAVTAVGCALTLVAVSAGCAR